MRRFGIGLCLLLCLLGSTGVSGMGREYANPLERRIAELTNYEREGHGLTRLQLDGRLTAAARGHSTEMLRLGYFEHFSPTPRLRTLQQRVQLEGGPTSFLGENIAYYEGYDVEAVARDVVADWMESPGHRANILRAGFKSLGVGLASDGHETYVTQDFSGTHATRPAPSTQGDGGRWIHIGPWEIHLSH